MTVANHVGTGQHVTESLPPPGYDTGAHGRNGPGPPDLHDGEQGPNQAVAQSDGAAVITHYPGPGHHAAQASAGAEELDEQGDDDYPDQGYQ